MSRKVADICPRTLHLEQFFQANGIGDEGIRRAVLLSVCGGSVYQSIRNLVAPGKPSNKSFSELVKLFRTHFCPSPSVTVQRYNFNSRSQRDGESVSHFVAELRKLSEHCDFGNSLENMLRDRLVCGIRDVRVQRRLLAEAGLTFANCKAFGLAQTSELAEKNVQDLQHSEGTPVHPSHKVEPAARPEGHAWSGNCSRVVAVSIRRLTVAVLKFLVCYKCGKQGHLARVCSSHGGVDYKLTVKSVDSYPLPRIDDVLASMTGAKVFSKLDLSHAYLQLQLEEESKEFATISTNKGLFRYNRLPFGVAAAPAIFQRTMEGILQDIPHVQVYMMIFWKQTRQKKYTWKPWRKSYISSAASRWGKIKEGKMQIHDVQCGVPGIPHLRGGNQTTEHKKSGRLFSMALGKGTG